MFLLKGLCSVALVSFSLCAKVKPSLQSSLETRYNTLCQELDKGNWEGVKLESASWRNFDFALDTFVKRIQRTDDMGNTNDVSLVLNMLISLEDKLNARPQDKSNPDASLTPIMDRLDQHIADVDNYLMQLVDKWLRKAQEHFSRDCLPLGVIKQLQTFACLLFTHSKTCTPWKEGYVPKERGDIETKQARRGEILLFARKTRRLIYRMPENDRAEAWDILRQLETLCRSVESQSTSLSKGEPAHLSPAILERRRAQEALEQSFDNLIEALSKGGAEHAIPKSPLWSEFEASLKRYEETFPNDKKKTSLDRISVELDMLVSLEKHVDWISTNNVDAAASLKFASDRLDELIALVESDLIAVTEQWLTKELEDFGKSDKILNFGYLRMLQKAAYLLFNRERFYTSHQKDYEKKHGDLVEKKRLLKEKIIEHMKQIEENIGRITDEDRKNTVKGILYMLKLVLPLEKPQDKSMNAAVLTDLGAGKSESRVFMPEGERYKNLRSALEKSYNTLDQELSNGKWEDAKLESASWKDFDNALKDFVTWIQKTDDLGDTNDVSLVLNMLISLEDKLNARPQDKSNPDASLTPIMDRLDQHIADVDNYLMQLVDKWLRKAQEHFSRDCLPLGVIKQLQTFACLLFTHSTTCTPLREGYMSKERGNIQKKQSLRQSIVVFIKLVESSIQRIPEVDQAEAKRILSQLCSLCSLDRLSHTCPPASKLPVTPTSETIKPRKTHLLAIAVVVCFGLGSLAALVALIRARVKMSIEN